MGHRHRNPAPGSRGFTLIELLTVVGILAVIAGGAIIAFSDTEQQATEKIIEGELAEIRKAVWRFKNDMGHNPQYLAELLQSPDPADAMGGWWWRPANDPPAAKYKFDPATRRGWDGPYLSKALTHEPSRAGTIVQERRIVKNSPSGGIEISITSTPASGKHLTAFLSPGQSLDPADSSDRSNSAVVSDYQLLFYDESDSINPEGEVKLRFLGRSARPQLRSMTIGLGIKP